jgi:hypothetical protein
MEKTTCTNLTDVVRSVQLLKVNGYSMTKTMDCEEGCIKSRWNVDGYDWEIRLYSAGLPGHGGFYSSWIAVELVFLSEARARNEKATLGYRLVDPIPTARLNKFSEERRHTVERGFSSGAGNYRSRSHRWICCARFGREILVFPSLAGYLFLHIGYI